MFFEKIINLFDIYHQRRILKFIKKFDVKYFIDVGTHKGEFLSYILRLNCKKIYCFEPQKEIFKILHKNYKNNKKVELFNLGLSDKSTNYKFYILIQVCLILITILIKVKSKNGKKKINT